MAVNGALKHVLQRMKEGQLGWGYKHRSELCFTVHTVTTSRSNTMEIARQNPTLHQASPLTRNDIPPQASLAPGRGVFRQPLFRECAPRFFPPSPQPRRGPLFSVRARKINDTTHHLQPSIIDSITASRSTMIPKSFHNPPYFIVDFDTG